MEQTPKQDTTMKLQIVCDTLSKKLFMGQIDKVVDQIKAYILSLDFDSTVGFTDRNPDYYLFLVGLSTSRMQLSQEYREFAEEHSNTIATFVSWFDMMRFTDDNVTQCRPKGAPENFEILTASLQFQFSSRLTSEGQQFVLENNSVSINKYAADILYFYEDALIAAQQNSS